MTAHYPKLRIPTASVTDTLLEIVISLRRWRSFGVEVRHKAASNRPRAISDPQAFALALIKQEMNSCREKQESQVRPGAEPQSLALPWT